MCVWVCQYTWSKVCVTFFGCHIHTCTCAHICMHTTKLIFATVFVYVLHVCQTSVHACAPSSNQVDMYMYMYSCMYVMSM